MLEVHGTNFFTYGVQDQKAFVDCLYSLFIYEVIANIKGWSSLFNKLFFFVFLDINFLVITQYFMPLLYYRFCTRHFA